LAARVVRILLLLLDKLAEATLLFGVVNTQFLVAKEVAEATDAHLLMLQSLILTHRRHRVEPFGHFIRHVPILAQVLTFIVGHLGQEFEIAL